MFSAIRREKGQKIYVLSVVVSSLLSGSCESQFEKVLSKGSKGR